jgi:hypothetical protein
MKWDETLKSTGEFVYCIAALCKDVFCVKKNLVIQMFSSPSIFNSDSTEPVFLYILRSPGIDSHPVGPVRQPYLTY